MLISPDAHSDSCERDGSRRMRIAELRRQLTRPSQLTDGHRQRLFDMAQRVARVQALGDEYRRVSLSETALDALNHQHAAAV